MSARRRRSAHPPMTAVAMPLDKLDLWLQVRNGAAATNLSMLDGFVTAVVAGPVSMGPARVDLPSARHRDRRIQSWRHAGVRGDLRRGGPSQCDRRDAHQRTQDL
jgi:hypothetical protein